MAVRNLPRRIGGQVLRGLESYADRVAPPNFTWAVTWFVTEVCNLRCKYCFVDFKKEHPPMEQHLETLLRLRPKYLMTVGGEPLLVDWLPEALAILKREVNPWVALTTNAMVSEERMRAVVPNIDSLVISIDGVGDYNKANRGVDSKKPLERLRVAHDLIRQKGFEQEISINVVVTRESFEGLPALYEAVREISSTVAICFNPSTPYTDPISVASDAATYHRFLDWLESLHETDPLLDLCGPGREEFNAQQNPEAGHNGVDLNLTRSGHHRVQCMRQFVWTNLWPDGRVVHCNPNLFGESFRRDLKDRMDRKRYLEVLLTGATMFDKMLLRSRSNDCYHPCNCLPFLDDIINHQEGRPLPIWTKWFQGRFNHQEIRAFDTFLEENFQRHLSAPVRRVLLGEERI